MENEQDVQTQEYNEQAIVLQQVGKNKDAYEYYDKAKKVNPMNIDTYINKAGLLIADGLYDLAMEQLQKAMKLDKHEGSIFFHIANIAFLKDNYQVAIENYNKALYEGFDDPKLYFYLGKIYEEIDDFNNALKNYKKAIRKEPINAQYRISKATLQMTKHKYEEALATLDETLQVIPDRYEGYHYSFEILLILERTDEAKAMIDKAIRLFPDDISLFYDLFVNALSDEHGIGDINITINLVIILSFCFIGIE